MTQLTPPSDVEGARIPKACQPCARAKVRCEFELGEQICQRCKRLKKTCGDQVPGAHRRKRPRTTNLSTLDEEMDKEGFVVEDSVPSPLTKTTIPILNAAFFSPSLWITRLLKSEDEAELLLQKFKVEFSPFFPFVVVPPHKTFFDLKDKNPFLVLVSLMVACRDDSMRQTAIAKKVREVISFTILVKGEHSLDLLQGVMLFLAWYHLHMHLGSQVCNLVHVMMALMTDLALNNSGTPKTLRPTYGSGSYFSNRGPVPVAAFGSDMTAVIPITKTLEGRRTFLGCFFLSSVVSMCARDIEPIKYSKYVAECCQVVLEGREYPNDAAAVHLVRLHGVGGRISRSLSPDEWDHSLGLNSAPIGACVKALESELTQLKESPAESLNEYVLSIHYYTVEVFLYEIALSDTIETERYGAYPFARLNMLYACLKSIRLLFDQVHAISSSEWYDIPYTTWALVGHAIVVLSRLSLCKVEGWNKEHNSSIIDFSVVVDALAKKFEVQRNPTIEEREETGTGSSKRAVPPQVFLMVSTKLQHIKAAQEAKYATQIDDFDQTSGALGPNPATSFVDDDFGIPPSTPFFDLLDENFWQQFM